MHTDILQRQQAIHPEHSFIVQAPAGSGKTEILIQRYLRLLTTVAAPEHIIALTFTRKAANEMRERILRALQETNAGVKPHSLHQEQTFHYAAEALAKDQLLGWRLLQNPARMQIFTIDALCQKLIHAIPLLETSNAFGQTSSKVEQHYQKAAQACLKYAAETSAYRPALKTLLRHLDNRQDYLYSLLTHLLSKRDQWLSPLHQARSQPKALFEQALEHIVDHELARFRQTIPPDCIEPLISLTRQLAFLEDNPESLRFELRTWTTLDGLSTEQCKALASVLLTSQGTLRKGFDHHIGLRRGVCPDSEYQQLKKESQSLLFQFSHSPDFCKALNRVSRLPKPSYDPYQWDVLHALFLLLPLLSAHLEMIFNEENVLDFIAVAQKALASLGEEGAPTDLALYLDFQIKHLLIDEFQDTSIQQFQLLTQLVQGWEKGDGRTVFVVGDPMQSIYRFRAAEVGLFLRAQKDGIGPVSLIPLKLNHNFRSSSAIVHWVNSQFGAIFPAYDDIESGAVSFHPSTASQGEKSDSYVTALHYSSTAEEAQGIVTLIQQELSRFPKDSMALLVRSRHQLRSIVALLRQQGISFQGVDIDPLAGLSHIRDVWSLTQALLKPAHRLSWLSLLRSPWCGLSLQDVHSIAHHANVKSIYSALSEAPHIPGLSEDGRQRVSFIHPIIQQALSRRYQLPLVTWVMNILKQLHMTHILNEQELNDLEQYWILLEEFDKAGQIGDLAQFEKELQKLYSKRVVPARLQIMTIHKSKGLEFDGVILPGLSAKPREGDKPLLRWLKLPTQHEETLLVAPLKAAHAECCPVYDYLEQLDKEKSQYELQRLLYVAATRTKKRLYLCDHGAQIYSGSMRHLLQHQTFQTIEVNPESEEHTPSFPRLKRLPLTFYTPVASTISSLSGKVSISTSNPLPRFIGIAAHALLQWICTHHPLSPTDIPWELANYSLKTQGMSEHEIKNALEHLRQMLFGLYNDPIGQWIIKQHEEEQNEYEVLLQSEHQPQLFIIDRTFCENGLRWVIDFKTGQDDETLHEQYHQQVTHYASLLRHRYPEKIHCGVYYLATHRWNHWEYI